MKRRHSVVDFGSGAGGLTTVGFTLLNVSDGATHTSRATDSVFELGTNTGIYGAAFTIPEDDNVYVLWDDGAATPTYAVGDSSGQINSIQDGTDRIRVIQNTIKNMADFNGEVMLRLAKMNDMQLNPDQIGAAMVQTLKGFNFGDQLQEHTTEIVSVKDITSKLYNDFMQSVPGLKYDDSRLVSMIDKLISENLGTRLTDILNAVAANNVNQLKSVFIGDMRKLDQAIRLIRQISENTSVKQIESGEMIKQQLAYRGEDKQILSKNIDMLNYTLNRIVENIGTIERSSQTMVNLNTTLNSLMNSVNNLLFQISQIKEDSNSQTVRGLEKGLRAMKSNIQALSSKPAYMAYVSPKIARR